MPTGMGKAARPCVKVRATCCGYMYAHSICSRRAEILAFVASFRCSQKPTSLAHGWALLGMQVSRALTITCKSRAHSRVKF